MKGVLAIDPSIRACGVATLYRGKIRLATLRPSRQGDLPQRCLSLWTQLQNWLTEPVKHLIVEYPTFQDTAKGRTAAVSGHINKLAFVCGYLCCGLVSTVETTTLVTPQEWKGFWSKQRTREHVLAHRIGKQLRGKTFDHNACDAAALALYYVDRRPRFVLSRALIFQVPEDR